MGCSCDAVQGVTEIVHVCTGALTAAACDGITCERGVKGERPCSVAGVAGCCWMPARGLYTQLYLDCTHPNCTTGFTQQCASLGGQLRPGACPVSLE